MIVDQNAVIWLAEHLADPNLGTFWPAVLALAAGWKCPPLSLAQRVSLREKGQWAAGGPCPGGIRPWIQAVFERAVVESGSEENAAAAHAALDRFQAQAQAAEVARRFAADRAAKISDPPADTSAANSRQSR